MNLTGNTILITGGGTGIGRGLAEAFQSLGNQVIIAGRRKSALDETTKANPGMQSIALDIENPDAIRSFAVQVTASYPALNVLINNAGIMRPEDMKANPVDLANAEAIITTNLLGPIRLTAALLPHFQQQPRATVINVSSGLAFVPLHVTPTYCATKAALHSWNQSLRYQLKSTSVEVLELAPPYVATDLMGGASDPRAMPLAAYIAEVMNILKTQPTPKEILVENVKPLRFAEQNGKYDVIFEGLNAELADHATHD